MAVTNYYTVDGEILGEATGGVRTDYLTDALGSVTATVDQGSTVLNTYRHKPYGGLLAKTGSSPDPKFLQLGGSMGVRSQSVSYADTYARTRHISTALGVFTSRALFPEWPHHESAYSFTDGNPVTLIDPSGRIPTLVQQLAGQRGGTVGTEPPPWWWPDWEPKPDTREGGEGKIGPVPVSVFRFLGTAGLVLVPVNLGQPCGQTFVIEMPKPRNRPKSPKDCQDLYDKYKEICHGAKGCSGSGSSLDYATRMGRLVWCAQARAQYVEACDFPGGGGRVPNPCSHAAEACQQFHLAKECNDKLGTSDFPRQDFTQAQRWCAALCRYCRLKGFDTGRFPSDFGCGTA